MQSGQCPFENIDFFKSLLPMKPHHLKDIENHASVFNNVNLLKEASNSCSLHTPKDVVFVGGSTPLILACQVGKLDAVKHIIEVWGVDVNASATYFSDPAILNSSKIRIEEASPLFVAAFHGHSRIVSFLLERGAASSVKLSPQKSGFISVFDGWTPLHGALSDLLNDSSQRPLLDQQKERKTIVWTLLKFKADPNADYSFSSSQGKPMWAESMCGIDTITALIHHGLDLKQRIPQTGQTLLHHITSRFTYDDSLMALVTLLVDNKADIMARDKEGFTPLLTAANTFNVKIFEYLMEREEYSRTEKMEALELAGATILLKAPTLFLKAFDYWRRAHQLREKEKEAVGPSAEKKLGRNIGTNLEWTTLAQLDQLEQQSEEYTIQAVLVKLRILSSFGGDGHRSLSSWSIDYISALSYSFDEQWLLRKFSQIVDIRLGMFDVIISRLDPLSTDRDVLLQIFEDADKLVDSLKNIYAPGLTRSNYYKMMKSSLDLILLATRLSTLNYERNIIDRCFQSIYPLLKMIFRLRELPDEANTVISLAQMLRQLEPYLGPDQLGKLLFSARPSFSYSRPFRFNLALIRVLLEAGADPNAVMSPGKNTLLHFAAYVSDRELGDAVGLLLVEFGAKPHLVNILGKTALDIWIKRNEREENWNEETGGWSARPEWSRQPVPKLERLAARVIRANKIPYIGGEVIPPSLYGVIESRQIL